MKKEQEDLMLKEICARMPYGVSVYYADYDDYYPVKGIRKSPLGYFELELDAVESSIYCSIDEVKLCLLPMSNITEEQYDELERMTLNDYMDHMRITNELREKVDFITHWPLYSPDVIDWFNRNHFDYRGLIEMGLALKAPDGMYK